MSKKGWAKGVLLTVLLITFLALAWRLWKTGRYNFDFTAVQSVDEARVFQRLANQLQEAEDWRPWPTNRGGDFTVWQERYDSLRERYPKSVILTDFGPRFVIAKASEPVSVKLAGDVPSQTDRGIYSRIADLMRSFPPPRDSQQRSQPPNEPPIKAAWRQRRWREWRELATTAEVMHLLDEYRLPAFPASPSSPFTAEAEADAETWVAAFRLAVQEQLVSLIEWHELLAETTRLRIGVHQDCQVFLVPRERRASFAEGTGRSAVADFTLEIRLAKGADSGPSAEFHPLVHYATGIDLHHVRLRPNGQQAGGIACDFSEAKVSVRAEQLQEFLHRLGLPREFRVKHLALEDQQPQAPGLSGLHLAYEVHHRNLPGTFTHTVPLAPDQFCFQVKRLSDSGQMASDSEALFRGMESIESLFGLPVTQAETQGSTTSAARLHVVVQYPVLGDVPLEVSMHGEGELIWEVKLNASRRRDIVRGICALEDELATQAAILECSPIQCDGHTGQLSGSVLASMDPKAQTLARWELDPGGHFRIYVPNHPPRQVASLPAVELEPKFPDSRQLRQAIAEHLHVTYPRLSEALQVLPLEESAAGRHLRITLQLADWPEISLGPAVVSEETYRQVVEQLLTGESVQSAATAGWSGGGPSARYGRVRLTLDAFDAEKALAHLTCEAQLAGGGVPLSWRERLEVHASEWQRSVSSPTEPAHWTSQKDDLEIALNQTLLPAVSRLEDLLENLLAERTGQDIKVDVERDAFGDGRWLTLNPLGVKVRFGIPIPIPDPFQTMDQRYLRVYAGGILVDSQNIALPDEYQVEFQGTFPFSNFALSDPAVRINLNKNELGIACKMTPPILWKKMILELPADGEGDGQNRIRLDNPWLEAFFLRTEIFGLLTGEELGVNLNVLALKKHEVGRGKATINFAKPTFLAQLRGPSPGQSFLPQLEGELLIDSNGFKSEMYWAGLGQGVYGEITVPFPEEGSESLPAFGVRTRMRLPVVGSVALDGVIQSTWDCGELNASGVLNPIFYPWGDEVQWEVNIVFGPTSPPRISYLYRWYSREGHCYEKHFQYESLEEVSESDMVAELKSHIDATGEPVKPPESENLTPEHRPGAPAVGVGDFGCDWQGDSLHLFRMPRDKNIDLAVIGPKEWEGFGITDAPEQVSSLLITVVNDSQLRIWLAIANRNSGQLWLSPRRDHAGPDGPPQELSVPGLGALLTRRGQKDPLTDLAVARFALAKVREQEPRSLAEASQGMKIELAKRPDAQAAPYYFCWINPNKTRKWTMLVPGSLAHRIRSLDQLVTCEDFQPHLDEQLIHLRSANDALDTVIGVYASVPSIPDSWTVHLWKNGRSHCLPLTICDALPSDQWMHALHRVAEATPDLFSGRLGGGEIVIGSQAVCLVQEDSLSLVRIDHGETGGLRRISGTTAIEWNHPNRRHLPTDWQSAAARKELWNTSFAKQLALAACRDWSRTRKQDQWQANPLGLLWKLSEPNPTSD